MSSSSRRSSRGFCGAQSMIMNGKSLVVVIFAMRCFNVDVAGGEELPCAEVIFKEPDDLTSEEWTERSMKKLEAEVKTAACTCINSNEEDYDTSSGEDYEDLYYYTINFPVFNKKEDLVVAPKRPIPSPVVISKIHSTHGTAAMTSLETYRSVGATLLVVVIWAIISGIIVWALDHRENSVEFPRPFFRGVREASWWALVTMTTVGYGDKTPKTMLARAYSVVWMLVGIVTISIVTAEISSTLTTKELQGQIISRVGVRTGGFDFFDEYSSQGKHVFDVKEFDNQAGLKKALDEGAVDAIVVYYCGPEFSQEKYTAVRSIRFPQHTFGVGAFWNVDGEKWPIYDNEYDGDLFKCLKNATRGERWIPRPKETPCHQTFKGAQRKGVIHKDSWMYVVIGSAALLVFILGVGAIYSWQFQKTTANLRGADRSELSPREALTVPGTEEEIPLESNSLPP